MRVAEDPGGRVLGGESTGPSVAVEEAAVTQGHFAAACDLLQRDSRVLGSVPRSLTRAGLFLVLFFSIQLIFILWKHAEEPRSSVG